METKNNKHSFSLSFSLVILSLAAAAASVACSNDHAHTSSDHHHAKLIIRTTCNGTIAECQADNTEEFQMDSEIHRRLLQQGGKNIGYGSLDQGRPACNSGNGKSYSDCTPHRNGNPPSRGCRPYEQCRVD